MVKSGLFNSSNKSSGFFFGFQIISPFDETIFLDVDMIWNPKKKPEDLFEELNNPDFTMCNEGYVVLLS